MEEKKQRRNKRILIISAMLVLLIALLCFGGITFAKYITSKDAPVKQATVAKWGFTVTVTADDMFSSDYNKDGAAVAADGENIVVKANSAESEGAERDKLVAPGTTGKMTISVKGNAEVNAELKIVEKLKAGTTTDEKNTPTKDVALVNGNTTVYSPIVWDITKKVGNGTATSLLESGDPKTLAKCLEKLADATVIAAGTDIDWTFELSWTWAFEGQNDYFDTVLGYAKAFEPGDDTSATGGNVASAANVKAEGDVFIANDKTITYWDTTNSAVATCTADTDIAFELAVSIAQTQTVAA